MALPKNVVPVLTVMLEKYAVSKGAGVGQGIQDRQHACKRVDHAQPPQVAVSKTAAPVSIVMQEKYAVSKGPGGQGTQGTQVAVLVKSLDSTSFFPSFVFGTVKKALIGWNIFRTFERL